MALANLDFSNSTSGNVAAMQLQLSGKRVLGHACGFPKGTNILSYFRFDFLIHIYHLLHLYWNIVVDNIVTQC